MRQRRLHGKPGVGRVIAGALVMLMLTVPAAFAQDASTAEASAWKARVQAAKALSSESPQRAIVRLNRMVIERPGDVAVIRLLAQLQRAHGPASDAIAWYRKLLELAPDAGGYLGLVGALESNGAMGDAAAAARRGAQAYPDNTELAVAAARLALETGDAAYAAGVLKKLERTGGDDAGIQFLLGQRAALAGELAAAHTAYRRATELDPGHERARDALRQLVDQALVAGAVAWLHTDAWSQSIDSALHVSSGQTLRLQNTQGDQLDVRARELAAWPSFPPFYRDSKDTPVNGIAYAGWLVQRNGLTPVPWAAACVLDGDGLGAPPRGDWRCAYLTRVGGQGAALVLEGCNQAGDCLDSLQREAGALVVTGREGQ